MVEDPSSVFICSYPKSGRTWLAWMLANYFNLSARLGLEIDFQTVFELVPADGSRTAPHQARAAGRIPLVKQKHALPHEVFRQVIFLVRDPLDTLVSQYFHETRQWRKQAPALPEFVRAQARDWVDYMNAWTARLPQLRSMVLAYEGRFGREQETLAEALRFIGVAGPDAGMLAEAVRRSSFAAMQAKEIAGPAIPGHDYDRADADARRVRQGKVGGWREHLGAEDAAAARDCIRAAGTPELLAFLRRHGYAAYADA